MKRVNLLPQTMQSRERGRSLFIRSNHLLRRLARTWHFVAVIGGLVLVLLWHRVAIQRYQTGTNRLRDELQQIRHLSEQSKAEQQALNVQRAELQARREQLETRRERLRRAHQPMVQVSLVLTNLVEVLPANVWITKLSFDGEQLALVGATTDAQSVAEIIANLDSSHRFGETRFTSTARTVQQGETVFTFEISTMPVLQARDGT